MSIPQINMKKFVDASPDGPASLQGTAELTIQMPRDLAHQIYTDRNYLLGAAQELRIAIAAVVTLAGGSVVVPVEMLPGMDLDALKMDLDEEAGTITVRVGASKSKIEVVEELPTEVLGADGRPADALKIDLDEEAGTITVLGADGRPAA